MGPLNEIYVQTWKNVSHVETICNGAAHEIYVLDSIKHPLKPRVNVSSLGFGYPPFVYHGLKPALLGILSSTPTKLRGNWSFSQEKIFLQQAANMAVRRNVVDYALKYMDFTRFVYERLVESLDEVLKESDKQVLHLWGIK